MVVVAMNGTMDERMERFEKGNIFEKLIRMQKPISEMNDREKNAEIGEWRKIMSRIPINVQEYLMMWDKDLNVQQHNFKSLTGTLKGLDCEVTHLFLQNLEARYDEVSEKYILDNGIARIPINALKRWTLVETSYEKQR